MNKKELLELIKIGPGYALEFKQSFSSNIGREMCAFANSSGGKILLGVTDNGNVKGYFLTNIDKSRIQDIARNMDPSLHITIEQVSNLVIIYVPEGKEKPYTINGHFYLRQGSNSQQLNRNEIRSLFQQENLIRFDRKVNPDFNMEDNFNQEAFNTFIKKANIQPSLAKEHILKNLGLITEGKLNNTGVLFFSRNISPLFLNSIITCVLYAGDTKMKILDKAEFHSDFVSNFNNAIVFLQRNLRTEYIIKKIKREEKLEVSEEVLRELVINAMTHRNYFSEGKVLVEIFSSRIEISNPGGLLFNKKDLGKTSFARNPLFVDMVHRLHFVERIGSGIGRVKQILGDKISFDISEDWFRVSIKRNIPHDTINHQNGTINHQNGTINDQNDTVNNQNDTINDQSGTINDQNGTVNNQNGTINHQNDTVNGQNDTINDQNDTVNNQNDTVNNQNDTVNNQNDTVNNQNDTVNDQNGTANDQNGTINDVDKQIILEIKKNPHTTYYQLEEKTKKSRRTIIRTLNKLKKNGIIQRIGSRKTGYWKVKK